MTKITTDVPADRQLSLSIEQQFLDMLDENEANFRAVSSPVSVRSLFRAAFAALDAADGPSVGLSARRSVDGDTIEWDVVLSVDHSSTVVCSEHDYTERAPEDVVAVILGCWDTAWDE